MAHHHADAHFLGLGHEASVFCQVARVEDGGHGEAGFFQRDGGEVGVVIVGDHDGAVADGDAEVHHVIAHGRSQHDAGDVVARKAQGAFDGAGGGDDLGGADAPEAVARAVRTGGVIGQTFVAQHVAVVIDPCPHGAGTEGNVVHGFEGIQGLSHESVG